MLTEGAYGYQNRYLSPFETAVATTIHRAYIVISKELLLVEEHDTPLENEHYACLQVDLPPWVAIHWQGPVPKSVYRRYALLQTVLILLDLEFTHKICLN